mmetsp:Transcript_12763/g.31034  ORF Transcript_12763/g.31034 Transcript_12763/m.31034 type:complete len:238 (-) Transcript_12763:255-968(-)
MHGRDSHPRIFRGSFLLSLLLFLFLLLLACIHCLACLSRLVAHRGLQWRLRGRRRWVLLVSGILLHEPGTRGDGHERGVDAGNRIEDRGGLQCGLAFPRTHCNSGLPLRRWRWRRCCRRRDGRYYDSGGRGGSSRRRRRWFLRRGRGRGVRFGGCALRVEIHPAGSLPSAVHGPKPGSTRAAAAANTSTAAANTAANSASTATAVTASDRSGLFAPRHRLRRLRRGLAIPSLHRVGR